MKSFNEDFKRAQAELKSLRFELKKQEEQLQSLGEKSENIREEYTSLLLQLSQFLGYKYDTKQHTVFEFTVAVKAMKLHFKALNKQTAKNNYGKRA